MYVPSISAKSVQILQICAFFCPTDWHLFCWSFVSVNVWHMETLNMWLNSIVFTYTVTLVLVHSGEAASIHASNKS